MDIKNGFLDTYLKIETDLSDTVESIKSSYKYFDTCNESLIRLRTALEKDKEFIEQIFINIANAQEDGNLSKFVAIGLELKQKLNKKEL